jgi:phenylacetate-CoA ligase
MTGSRTPPTDQIWNPEYECMERENLEMLQGKRLFEQVKHVYNNSDFFQKLYDSHDIHPTDIEGLDDLQELPTFTKDDLRDYREETGDFWCGALCVPESQLEIAHHSTGTSGKPNFYGLTENDISSLRETFARQVYAWGLRRGDKINVHGKVMWHGYKFGFVEGCQEVGTVPVMTAQTGHDVDDLFGDLSEADLDGVFVYSAEIEKEYADENDIDPAEVFPNARIVASAVDASTPKIQLWEELWDATFKNAYASGDQYWTTIPCPHDEKYYHVPEDQFIFEVLDPETKEPVEPGEYGLLYVTNLRDEANPYIRYGMEDLVDYKISPCECGRTTMRVRPLGRLSWCVDIIGRDQPVTSIEVEEIVWSYEELYGTNYQLVETNPDEQEVLRVRIAIQHEPDIGTIESLESDLEAEFGIPSEISIVDPDDIGLESDIKMERVAEEY